MRKEHSVCKCSVIISSLSVRSFKDETSREWSDSFFVVMSCSVVKVEVDRCNTT